MFYKEAYQKVCEYYEREYREISKVENEAWLKLREIQSRKEEIESKWDEAIKEYEMHCD